MVANERRYHHRKWTSRRPPSRPIRRPVRSPFSHRNWTNFSGPVISHANGTVTASATYDYDPNGNLTSKTVTLPNNPADGTNTYTYDQQDRLTSWTNPTSIATNYSWDDAGNRTQAGNIAYTYDARNRLTSSTDGSTYTWNARGDLTTATTATGTSTYGYDAFSRMTTATTSGGTTTYSYDSLDRLLSRNSDTLTYTGTSIKPSTDGNQSYARTADDALLAASDGTTTTLAGVDRHRDLTYLANADGSVSGSHLYDPFGTVIGNAGSFGIALGYQSDLTDAGTGQVWMGARWYNPDAAAFDTQDTVTGGVDNPISLNRYTYANGDPETFFDPDGHATGCLDSCGSNDVMIVNNHQRAGVLSGPSPGIRTLYLSAPMMRGGDVTWAQRQLNAAGAHLVTDGAFGPATRQATIAYQRRQGLPASGVIGSKTWKALERSAPRPAIDVAALTSLLGAVRQQLELDMYSSCLYMARAGGRADCGTRYPAAAARAERWSAQADSFFQSIPVIPGAVRDARGCFLHGSVTGCINTALNVALVVPGADVGDAAARELVHEAEDAVAQGVEKRAAEGGLSSVGAASFRDPAFSTPDLEADPAQLEAKYKHAGDFGVTAPRGTTGFQQFGKALSEFVNSGSTIRMWGTYRRSPAVLNFDVNSGRVVVQYPDGAFWTGFRANAAQLANIIERRSLGGG